LTSEEKLISEKSRVQKSVDNQLKHLKEIEKSLRSEEIKSDNITSEENNTSIVIENPVKIWNEKKPMKQWSDIVEQDEKKNPVAKKIPASIKTGPVQILCTIAKGVAIPAFHITSNESCLNHLGYLCYNTKTSRFLYAINDIIFLGGMCDILSIRAEHKRVLEYDPKIAEKGRNPNFIKKDKDWHNPKNLREYLSNKIKYISYEDQQSENTYFDSYAINIGSKDKLENDLAHAKPTHCRIVHDLAFHWWTVSLVIKNKQKNQSSAF